ncbi:hypothetical protein J7T55_012940 [Diaporthe amygdali]|uniref:uncharacterized protein n=1 Tax=Phomopsis amygdali TaxID=1214568 RepID=UPI0022FECD64|nr:uncharacterized protein J7T55_012940 [Diaporthe amygdali]KAJ0118686.1 hypothetical protein J7T55_012940 [Diaporthe amygdali]
MYDSQQPASQAILCQRAVPIMADPTLKYSCPANSGEAARQTHPRKESGTACPISGKAGASSTDAAIDSVTGSATGAATGVVTGAATGAAIDAAIDAVIGVVIGAATDVVIDAVTDGLQYVSNNFVYGVLGDWTLIVKTAYLKDIF